MSTTTATRHQQLSASGSGGRKPNQVGGGKKPARVEAIRCKLCLRPGHKEGDCPSRAGPANAQANHNRQRHPRKENNARDRRRMRRQEERQQQQQQQEQQQQLGEAEQMRDENKQLYEENQQLREEIQQLHEENQQLWQEARQLHFELLDLHLQQSEQVEQGEHGGEEDGEQYP